MSKGLDYLINLKEGDFSGTIRGKGELQGMDQAIVTTGSNMGGLSSMAIKAGTAMAGAFAALGLKSTLDDLIAVRGEFQGFENLLTNQLGNAGQKVFEDIKKFAASTPFEVDELTESFIKLQGSGFAPTMDKMAMLGDLSASKMKSIGQFTEAVLDAQSGEFERLKEFGIRASKSGENVTFTYNGVAKTMKFSQKSTEDYLLSLSRMPGIMGSMDAMANTYIGKQSNINDQITQFKDNLAKDLEPVLNTYLDLQSKGIVVMQESVAWVKENSDMLKMLGAEVGIAGGAYLIASSALGVYNAYQAATATGTTLWTLAQQGLNAAFKANPIGAVIGGMTAIVGFFTILYKKSETFRASIDGLIEVGKLVGEVFMGVGKTIVGALTFDKDMFLKGIAETAIVTQKILGGGIQSAFNKGFEDSKRNFKAEQLSEKSVKTGIDSLVPKPKSLSGVKTLAASASGVDSTSVQSSKQSRSVIVTIGRLVENLTVSTTNLQGAGSADIKRMITELLVGAVHDSELALSS